MRSEQGFTLIEMMAAVILLAVCLSALAALPIASVKANRHAHHVASATNLALDKIEDLRGTGWSILADGADASPLRTTADAGTRAAADFYARSWAVQTGPAASTKQVLVTVAWHDLIEHQVVLRTVISK